MRLCYDVQLHPVRIIYILSWTEISHADWSQKNTLGLLGLRICHYFVMGYHVGDFILEFYIDNLLTTT